MRLGSDFHCGTCISAHTIPDSLKAHPHATVFVTVFVFFFIISHKTQKVKREKEIMCFLRTKHGEKVRLWRSEIHQRWMKSCFAGLYDVGRGFTPAVTLSQARRIRPLCRFTTPPVILRKAKNLTYYPYNRRAQAPALHSEILVRAQILRFARG